MMQVVLRGIFCVFAVFCLVESVQSQLRLDIIPETKPDGNRPVIESVAKRTKAGPLIVDARENCIFMTETERPMEKAARRALEPNRVYSIAVSGEAFLSGHTRSKADPFPGVVVFYCTNEQDGYATKMKVMQPGEALSFVTPRKKGKDLFLSAFFIDYWPDSMNRGRYELAIRSKAVRGKPSKDADRILNVNFGKDPDSGLFDGVIGGKHDFWTLVDVGERTKSGLRFADGAASDVVLELSENDGEWGIEDHLGVYHAYLYDNCRCVDLSLKLSDLPAGTYEAYVFAHGDAPNQNALIEIQSAGTTYSGRSTLNDGTYRYRSHEYEEGNQYVKYTILVEAGKPVLITSRRAGSSLSMFNAIQLKRLK